MKRQIFTSLMTLAIFMSLAIGPAYGQKVNRAIKAKLPFEFVVGDKTLPAGEYTLEQLSPVVLVIKNSDGRTVTTVQTRACASVEHKSEASVVFNKYADRYFLSQIWTAGDNQGRELKRSMDENELARSGVKRETVSIASK